MRRSYKRNSTPVVCRHCSDELPALGRFRIREYWQLLRAEHLSFIFLCGYYFVEFTRIQRIIPGLDVLPWAQIFILLAAVAWVVDRNRQVPFSGIFFWICIFNLIAVLSAMNAVFPDHAWAELHQYYNWVVVFFLTVAITNTRQRLFVLLLLIMLTIFKVSLSSSLSFASRGFSFASWGLMGPEGWFQNSGELAMLMLIFVPLAWYFSQAMRPHVRNWIYWLMVFASFTGVLTIIGSSSRGGQLALVVQLLMMAVAGRVRLRTFLVVLLVAAMAYLALPEQQKQRFTTAGTDQTSTSRLTYWRNGMEMMQDHPGLGVGVNSFSLYHARYYSEDAEQIGRQEVAHNTLVQVGAGMGYSGLAVYVLLLLLGWLRCRALARQAPSDGDALCFDAMMARGLAVGLWGFIISGQFISAAIYPPLWIQLALIASLSNIVQQSDAGRDTLRNRRQRRRAKLAATAT